MILNWLENLRLMWRLPVANLEAQAQAVAGLLGQLMQAQQLHCSGSAAVAIALQRLVPQLASLTIGLYGRNADGSTGPRAQNALSEGLNYTISDVSTGYEFWAAMYENLLESNNAYATIVTKPGQAGPTLRVVPAHLVLITRPDPVGRPWALDYTWNGKPVPADSLWHLRLHTQDGVHGRHWAHELAVFELAHATEVLAFSYFANGGNVERIWKYAGLNTDGKGLASREQIEQQQGLLNEILRLQIGKNGNVVVPSYFDYKDTGTNFRDAQMMESRRYNSEEILSLYGIDPAKPADLESIYCVALVPILEAVEQSIARSLLTDAQRKMYKVKYIAAGRFRGQVNLWMKALGEAVQGTLITPNEGRSMLGLGLGDCPEGNALTNPHTMPAAVSTAREAAAGGGSQP